MISGATKHAHVRGCSPRPSSGGVCAGLVLDENCCRQKAQGAEGVQVKAHGSRRDLHLR